MLLTADKRLTKYLATQRAASPSVIVARGYLLDFPKLAADLLEALDAVAQVIGSDGHAVFSMDRIGRPEPNCCRWSPRLAEVCQRRSPSAYPVPEPRLPRPSQPSNDPS